MSLFEGTIIAFITLSILWHVWKGGAANPESTGSLGRTVNSLSAKVTTMSGKVENLETELDELKQKAATTTDIQHLEKSFGERIETVRAEAAGHKALSEATNRNVQRIYDIMLEKGLGK